MSLRETKAKKTVEFYENAKRDGLVEKMHPEKRTLVEEFVRDHAAAKAPGSVMREYELKRKPLDLVFERTHLCLKSQVALFEAHAPLTGNVALVQAETGPWLLGANEEDDLELLLKWQPIFVKFFGAVVLPAALKKEALEKQTAEHREARKKLPPLPPKETLTLEQGIQRELAGRADKAFTAFHDFLDGYFGKDGPEAFVEKAKYAYDRRAGRYTSSSKAAKPSKADGANERAPATPGPVAAGTAGQLPASAIARPPGAPETTQAPDMTAPQKES